MPGLSIFISWGGNAKRRIAFFELKFEPQEGGYEQVG
jgi:hypothetical protein